MVDFPGRAGFDERNKHVTQKTLAPHMLRPASNGMQERTLHLTAQDGTGLAGSVWDVKKPRILVVWLHGFAEHRRRYQNFGNWLSSKKIAFAAVDLRGHGDSEGKRGFIKRFEEYYRDIAAMLHWAKNNYPGAKFILGAHSHGGLVAARYVEEGALPLKLAALILTGPFLGLATVPPAWQKNLVLRAARVFPAMPIPTGIDPAFLSHDPDVVLAYKHDPLVFRSARARWLAEVLKHQRLVQNKAPSIKIPTLVMQGMADRVVSVDAVRRFYAGLETKKRWIGYDDGYHEILNEPNRETVYRDMFAWIKKTV